MITKIKKIGKTFDRAEILSFNGILLRIHLVMDKLKDKPLLQSYKVQQQLSQELMQQKKVPEQIVLLNMHI